MKDQGNVLLLPWNFQAQRIRKVQKIVDVCHKKQRCGVSTTPSRVFSIVDQPLFITKREPSLRNP